MNRRHFTALTLTSPLVASRAGAAAAEAQSVHLSVGTVPTDAGIGPVIAQRGGFFRKNGLDVDVVFMTSGSAMGAALVGGSLQVAGTTIMSLVTSHAKGLPFQIIAPGNMYVSGKPSEVLVVRKDSPIRDAADLNGKTIGVPALGDFFSIATSAWVDQNGGDSRSLHNIELPTAGAPAALEAGRIDAAVLPEPVLSQTLNSGLTRILGKPYDAISPTFPIAVNFALPEFINANRDVVQRYYRSMIQAAAFGNAHPTQTAPWLAEITKIDVATINRGHREILSEGLVVAEVQRVIDVAAKYKFIDRAFDARDLISPAILNLKG